MKFICRQLPVPLEDDNATNTRNPLSYFVRPTFIDICICRYRTTTLLKIYIIINEKTRPVAGTGYMTSSKDTCGPERAYG